MKTFLKLITPTLLLTLWIIALVILLVLLASPADAAQPAQITIIVTGAVPVTPPAVMPTPAPWCPPSLDPNIHRWYCDNGRTIPIYDTYLPVVAAGGWR